MLDKAIEHGKEKRKKYRGAKAIDASCRNHGTCEWCEGNRNYSNRKRREAADEEWEEFKKFGLTDKED